MDLDLTVEKPLWTHHRIWTLSSTFSYVIIKETFLKSAKPKCFFKAHMSLQAATMSLGTVQEDSEDEDSVQRSNFAPRQLSSESRQMSPLFSKAPHTGLSISFLLLLTFKNFLLISTLHLHVHIILIPFQASTAADWSSSMLALRRRPSYNKTLLHIIFKSEQADEMRVRILFHLWQ